jgi:hypothetical protein
MESVDFMDRYLDPPDGPTHWECDMCGEIFDGGDLNQIDNDDYWLCDECLGNSLQSIAEEE